jgi:hypothetical protein
MTPLHWAAVKGSKACIKHLIEAGADLNAKEGQGKTPRDMAEELKGVYKGIGRGWVYESRSSYIEQVWRGESAVVGGVGVS